MDGFVCNLCYASLHGIAYRTSCYHLFCPMCAQTSFRKHKCPICPCNLNRDCIFETVVGAKGSNLAEHLFQQVLGGSCFQESSKLLRSIFFSVQEVSDFLCAQQDLRAKLITNIQQDCEDKLAEKDAQIAELSKRLGVEQEAWTARLENISSELADKTLEISQLQESLKEKLRKCQAWERAYSNIRSQLSTKQPLQSSYLNEPSPAIPAVTIRTYRQVPDREGDRAFVQSSFSTMPCSLTADIGPDGQQRGQKRPAPFAASENNAERRLQMRGLMAARGYGAVDRGAGILQSPWLTEGEHSAPRAATGKFFSSK